jgi:hypothetical protein
MTAQEPIDTKSGGAPLAEIDVEKHSSKHHETAEDDEVRKTKGDYSGAVGKTDPAEVKLVRKLDLWIMVSLLLLPFFTLSQGDTD